jgi:putative phosphoribosyl transferase
MIFANRAEAGRSLAWRLEKYDNRNDVVVLAISRGGVPVAVEDAEGLHAPLDLLLRSSEVEAITAEAQQELERREAAYRGDQSPLSVAGKTVILVDDGIATVASLLAAIRALRQLRPAKIVLAVPVAPRPDCEQLAHDVDELVCVASPEPFGPVGQFYDRFPQVEDEEVVALLARHQCAESVTVA